MYVHPRNFPGSSRWFRPALLAIGLTLLASLAAYACNVPVFRFALERWRADSYRVTLLHRGPLTEEQRRIVAVLEQKSSDKAANFVVRKLDVSQSLDEADQMLLEADAGGELPRLVVRYPEHLRIEVPVWSGPLSDESIATLTDSPVRQELIRRLTAGETAVWLLLETGAPETDDAIAAMMEAELKKLEKFITLPELTEAPADDLLTEVPLRVAFSLLRVPRNDPREQALVGMLLRAEPDLFERNDPMAFPVFGRGRALLPLVGPGITPVNMHDSAAFLVGPCSCEIKELNPGFDLLLSASWDDLIFDGEVPPQVLISEAAAVDTDPVYVPIPSGARGSASTVVASLSGDHATPPAAAEEEAVTAHPSASPPSSDAGSTADGAGGRILLTLVGMVLVTMLAIGYGYK